jgi:hypothetical protein
LGPGNRSSFAAAVECGDPCLRTVSYRDPALGGLPTPGEGRQVVKATCQPFLFYHGSVIRALGKLRLPAIFSDDVSKSIRAIGIKPKRTAYRSPWQNGVAERWVGSCKREIIDHVIVFNEDHLRRLLRDYVAYYNAERVQAVIRDAPEARAIEARPSPDAKGVGLPRATRKLRFLPFSIATCGKKQPSDRRWRPFDVHKGCGCFLMTDRGLPVFLARLRAQTADQRA